METQYQNLYSHLYLFNPGSNFDAAQISRKNDSMPKLNVTQAVGLQNGDYTVVSPPPHHSYITSFSKAVPKGRFICCITSLNELVKAKPTNEEKMETEMNVPSERETDTMEQ